MRRRLRSTTVVTARAVTLALLFTLIPIHFAFAGAVTVLAPVSEADGRLGLCDVLPGLTPGPHGVAWAQLAVNAGARINRWEFRWDRVEARPGVWDFSRDDPAVVSDAGAGLETLGILIGTPGWAVTPGSKPGNGVPRGLYRAGTDPRNLWADYVRQTVTHYKGQVRWWEVWNEPDLSFFWSGTAADYVQLLKVAYLTVKSVDPAARVLVAGMVVPDLTFLSQVLDGAGHGAQSGSNHTYFDALAWHAYGPAAATYTNVRRMEALLSRKAMSAVPIWVTEDGFPASNPNGLQRQAAYVLQTVLYAFAAGASHVLVYREADDTEPKQWGLLDATGTPRFAYVAYQVAARYLSHWQAIVYDPAPHLERFTVYEPGRRLTVLWADGLADRIVRVSADMPGAQAVSWDGTTFSPSAAAGQYALQLPGATYNAGVDPSGSIVGGPPRILVEDNAPPNGLGSSLGLPSLDGAHRRLLLYNPSGSPGDAQVTVTDAPVEREAVRLGPGTVQRLDLDALAGTAYAGSYTVSTSGGVQVEAVSDNSVVSPVPPSTTWYVPAASTAVRLFDADGRGARVTVTAYGPGGGVRQRAALDLLPGQPGTWSPSAGRPLSLSIQSNDPIIVAPPALAVPRTVWYVLHPHGMLVAFNPSHQVSLSLDVGYIGAPAVRGLQLRLGPRHTFTLPTHGAHAVVVQASGGTVLGYATAGTASTPLLGQAETRTDMTVAGKTRSVVILNPSPHEAHLTLVSTTGSTPEYRTVRPDHVYTVPVYRPGGLPVGLSVQSDVPVVAVAGK